MKRATGANPTTLVVASIWVSGPVLLKLVSDVHSSSSIALAISCAVLMLWWLDAFSAPARSGQRRQDLAFLVWGFAVLGGAPALLIAGLVRTDAVSVALIGGLFIFIVPVLAWLRRKAELDSGFLLVFVLASAGIYAMLDGRVRFAEATVLGDMLLIFCGVILVLGSMLGPPCSAGEPLPLRRTVVQFSGAALFYAGLVMVFELNWFGSKSADGFPLLGMLAATFSAYWCSRHWRRDEFEWQEWPILFLAVLFPIGVVLGKTFFVEMLDLGEMVCVGVVTIIVSTAHWLRRWLNS